MRDTPADPFAEFLATVRSSAPTPLLRALLDVSDTSYACSLWFESRGLTPSAADVVAMSGLVLDREAELRARDEAVQPSRPQPAAPSPRDPTPADPWGG
jgi:hypothetical protein